MNKNQETVSHRQNNTVKEVGTPPVGSNLCISLIAVSTAVRSKVTQTVSKKQLLSKIVYFASTLYVRKAILPAGCVPPVSSFNFFLTVCVCAGTCFISWTKDRLDLRLDFF